MRNALLVVALACLACQSADRLDRLDRQQLELRDQYRDLDRRTSALEWPGWWCTIAGCRRTRADCDLAAAQLAASTQARPQPIAREECKAQRVAWCVDGRCWATLRQCGDVETEPGRCAGVE